MGAKLVQIEQKTKFNLSFFLGEAKLYADLLIISLFYHLPVNNLPQGSQVVGTTVLIVQIVGMLPNVESQQRFQAFLNRIGSIRLLSAD